METKNIGIILSGVTGRMGTNQHLIRSVLAIIKQGGVKVSDNLRLMPDPILVGRSANKLKGLAEAYGPSAIGKPLNYSTDLDSVLGDKAYDIFFDASGTLQRAGFVEKAVKARKAVYCEKPTAVTTGEALWLAKLCESAGLKNGVVQDKLWLPGMRKIQMLRQQGFFGKVLSVRGEFGYWVFTGEIDDQPAQRPSWNYRTEDGGGIMVDMFCHWQYVVSNLFGPIKSLVAYGNTDLPERVDESGKTYKATADDSAYAIFLLEDGTCVAGLREAWVQSKTETPKPVWNPDIAQPINFYEGWQKVPEATHYDNAFKIQWELFLRHVALDEPFRWTLREGAKGVQLAELGLKSWTDRKWVDVPALE
jgi:predicted dehydrogenase